MALSVWREAAGSPRHRLPVAQLLVVRRHDIIVFMKRFFNDWWVGFQFLMRLGIVSFVMIVGFGLLNDLGSHLKAAGMLFLYYATLFIQFVYICLFVPFVIASYARYCGYVSGKKDQKL